MQHLSSSIQRVLYLTKYNSAIVVQMIHNKNTKKTDNFALLLTGNIQVIKTSQIIFELLNNVLQLKFNVFIKKR